MTTITGDTKQLCQQYSTSVATLPTVLAPFDFDSVFLVTGTHSYRQPALHDVLSPLLETVPHDRYYGFENNPKEADVLEGIRRIQALKNPLILAIGGGSAMDMAKLIHYFSQTDLTLTTFFETKAPPQKARLPRPLVMIPTTSGTGSEATQFATLYINQIKCSLDTPAIVPDCVLLDPELTHSLPPLPTAESGMDALTQAVESYWSIHATQESKQYARQAIALLWPHIEVASMGLNKGNCVDTDIIAFARQAMQVGSHLAGKAINITRTTAPHAISYPMTSFFNVAHGQAVSISLPHFLTFNAEVSESDCLDARGVPYVQRTLNEIASFLGCNTIQEARHVWQEKMKRIGLKTTLIELGITQSNWDIVVEHGFNPARVKNNPRRLDEATLRALLQDMALS